MGGSSVLLHSCIILHDVYGGSAMVERLHSDVTFLMALGLLSQLSVEELNSSAHYAPSHL